MTSNILKTVRGAVNNFQFTNVHFDVIGTAGAVVAYMAGQESAWTRGLRGFVIAAWADRGIAALGKLPIRGDYVLGNLKNISL